VDAWKSLLIEGLLEATRRTQNPELSLSFIGKLYLRGRTATP
jgi:hypothetical protein